MVTAPTEQKIIAACREISETYGLEQVYLTEIVGPRRHYIAGYGLPSLERAGQVQVSDRLILFWHGTLSPEMQETCKTKFTPLVAGIEQELSTETHST